MYINKYIYIYIYILYIYIHILVHIFGCILCTQVGLNHYAPKQCHRISTQSVQTQNKQNGRGSGHKLQPPPPHFQFL